MRFTWDEQKRRLNLAKHEVDFGDLAPVFDGYTVTTADTRFDYPEPRFVTVGLLHGRVVVLGHTEEAAEIRFISARKATRHEEQSYFATVRNRLGTPRSARRRGHRPE